MPPTLTVLHLSPPPRRKDLSGFAEGSSLCCPGCQVSPRRTCLSLYLIIWHRGGEEHKVPLTPMQQHKQSYLVSQGRLVDDHGTLKPLLASGCPHAAPAGPTAAQAPQEPVCVGLGWAAAPIAGPHPWVPPQRDPPGDPKQVLFPPCSPTWVTHMLGQSMWRALCARALPSQTQGRSGMGMN